MYYCSVHPALEADGNVARIDHRGEGAADAHRYRYTATRIADGVDAFADYVLDRHGSTGFDASDEGRRLLSETQDEGGSLRICHHELDGVNEETAERRRAAVDDLEREIDARHPAGYVRYEGQWYRIEIFQFGV